MLNVILMSVVMLCVVMLNVVLLSVVAPQKNCLKKFVTSFENISLAEVVEATASNTKAKIYTTFSVLRVVATCVFKCYFALRFLS
jgi:hypothetical protein